MSGKDERKTFRKPRCLTCAGHQDIIVKYGNGVNAGWIISDRDEKWLGVSIVLNTRYTTAHAPKLAFCLDCGTVKNRRAMEELSDKAIEFFTKQIQIGNYITWEIYSERNRNERKG